MMYDWTNIWYDRFEGEMHLMILPNDDHGIKKIDAVFQNMALMVRSLAEQRTYRPEFYYKRNETTGALLV